MSSTNNQNRINAELKEYLNSEFKDFILEVLGCPYSYDDDEDKVLEYCQNVNTVLKDIVTQLKKVIAEKN